MDSLQTLELPGYVLQATRAIPPRPYTDILVQNFFDMVNYHYDILHAPSFMPAYTEWWHQRREASNSRSISYIALTCLVLRICANSAQFLSAETQSQLESDFGDSVNNLGKGYQAAADILSDFLPVGSAGLVNAQQLFLAATYLKAEADFVKSWHELAACVRQAQEIGMCDATEVLTGYTYCYTVGIHTDRQSQDMSYFERDSRRRLWCAAYTWDK